MNRAALIIFHRNTSASADCTDTEINAVSGFFDFGFNTYKAFDTVSM